MSQHDFDELLQKYLAGTCTPAEEQLILDWYQHQMAQSMPDVPPPEKELIRQRIWHKLTSSTGVGHRLVGWKTRYSYALITCLLLVITLGIWQFVGLLAPARLVLSPPETAGLELNNHTPKPQTIRLEDGSTVRLTPGSQLRYPDHFGPQNRTVLLTGEAFFTIQKDLTRPFIVHTGPLITEVLGTSFSIKSKPGTEAIEVAVATGRVAVYQAADAADRQQREIILKPNERLTYSPHSQQLIPALVEAPVRVISPEPAIKLNFDETPLPQVLTRLEAIYGIDLYLESDGLRNCVLTADLNDLPLFEQLELICRSVDAHYEIRGTSIFIIGPGCR